MATDQITAQPIFLLPITGKRDRRHGAIVAYSIILDDEFSRREIIPHSWNLHYNGYAQGRLSGTILVPIRLHKLVYRHYHGALALGFEVDHIDRNKLNNLPSNLRALTRSKNNANSKIRRDNSSGFRCVSLDRRRQKWTATIHANSRRFFLGLFDTPLEAAAAVNVAYAIHHPHVPPPNKLA